MPVRSVVFCGHGIRVELDGEGVQREKHVEDVDGAMHADNDLARAQDGKNLAKGALFQPHKDRNEAKVFRQGFCLDSKRRNSIP